MKNANAKTQIIRTLKKTAIPAHGDVICDAPAGARIINASGVSLRFLNDDVAGTPERSPATFAAQIDADCIQFAQQRIDASNAELNTISHR